MGTPAQTMRFCSVTRAWISSGRVMTWVFGNAFR